MKKSAAAMLMSMFQCLKEVKMIRIRQGII